MFWYKKNRCRLLVLTKANFLCLIFSISNCNACFTFSGLLKFMTKNCLNTKIGRVFKLAIAWFVNSLSFSHEQTNQTLFCIFWNCYYWCWSWLSPPSNVIWIGWNTPPAKPAWGEITLQKIYIRKKKVYFKRKLTMKRQM